MGEKVFTMAQYGVEVTKGTAVASTKIWPGTVKLGTDRTPKFVKYANGRRGGATATRVDQIHASDIVLTMEDGAFEKLPLLFSMLLKGGVTPVAGVWTFDPSLTAAGTYNAITLEYGDDTEQYEIPYCMCTSVRISGRLGADEPVKVEARCFGQKIDVTGFTGGLTQGTLTGMIANIATLWIDSSWAGLGGTKKSALLRSYDIEITNGVHPKWLADGSLSYNAYGEGELGIVASFDYEGGTDADTEYDKFIAGTPQAFRLLIGDATNGLQIDWYGAYELVLPLGSESEGNNITTAVVQGMDDNGATPHKLLVKVNTPATGV